MIGYSIAVWLCGLLLIGVSISLFKGNINLVHGKVFDNTPYKEEYAKSMGKPAMFLGIIIIISGILAIVIKGDNAIIYSTAFLVTMVIIGILWMFKINSKFKNKTK